MPLLRTSFGGFIVAVFALGCLALPRITLAANTTTCECFCGDTTNGAVAAGVKTSSSDCSATCTTAKKTYVGCYKSEDQYPVHNDKCWTLAECTTWTKTIGSTTYTGEFGNQNQYCSPSNSGAAMGYCYGPNTPVNLNVALLGKTTVSGLPEYLAAAYNFAIPALALVAVVMLMFGGLGYATARGNAKAVDKAKSRITNALIGLILLLSAYAITSFIDPRLVSFNALKVPLIKTVVLLDSAATCEVLASYKYDISPTSGECGKATGKIISIDNVIENVSTSAWKVGSTCQFSYCPTAGEGCLTTSEGGTCYACDKVPSPSDAVCASIQFSVDANDTNVDHHYYCLYGDTESNTGCVSMHTSGDLSVNCSQLRSEALDAADKCNVYDKVLASDNAFVEAGAAGAKKVCEEDPCVLNITGCVYTVQYQASGLGSCSSVDTGQLNDLYGL